MILLYLPSFQYIALVYHLRENIMMMNIKPCSQTPVWEHTDNRNFVSCINAIDLFFYWKRSFRRHAVPKPEFGNEGASPRCALPHYRPPLQQAR